MHSWNEYGHFTNRSNVHACMHMQFFQCNRWGHMVGIQLKFSERIRTILKLGMASPHYLLTIILFVFFSFLSTSPPHPNTLCSLWSILLAKATATYRLLIPTRQDAGKERSKLTIVHTACTTLPQLFNSCFCHSF